LAPHPERVNGVDRRTFSIPLEPGAIFEDAIRIFNRTDQPLKLVLYPADAEATQSEVTVNFQSTRLRGVGSWIDLSRGSVELAPRGEIVVTFRVRVKSAEPSPKYGAIVVDNADKGLSSNASQRLDILVLTLPPNTATTSQRVRPLLLRSPWIVVAMLGLIVAAAVLWIGARRSRRPRDIVVAPGEMDEGEEDIPDSSRPVIKRLGSRESDVVAPAATTSALERARARAARVSRRRDDRPIVDDSLVVEVDNRPGDELGPEDEAIGDTRDVVVEQDKGLPPPRRASGGGKRRSAAPSGVTAAKKAKSAKRRSGRRASKKPATARRSKATANPRTEQGYIPLDEL
jgi:hypothetical protein